METSIRGDPCLVCGGPTKGLHFQVASCRACAAFFRRSIQAGKEYKCQRGDGRCNLMLKVKGKTLCKFCRLKKCQQLGMRLDKESEHLFDENNMDIGQFPDDMNSPPEIHLPQEPVMKEFREVPEKKEKVIVDMSPLDRKIREILSRTSSTFIAPIPLTFMQQLTFGFTRFYNEIRPNTQVIVTNEFDRMRSMKFHQTYMIELAEMLMCCDKFAKLDFEDKFMLYKNLRPIFTNLERHYTSVLYFGTDFDNVKVLNDNNTAMDFNIDKIKIHDIDPEMFQKTIPLWIPIRDKNIKFLMNPMKTLQLSEFELVFLLAHILWTVQDINGLSENAINVSEEVTEQIATDLHNYYTYEMRLGNYAPRLVKITKLIDAAKEIRHAKQDVFTIAKIFDMFRLEIVGSELTEL